ncbi:DUF692 domain-containing protein [Dongia sp.]|uniref:MNIO family bufferin maturase n=1 Tax=Dongia sp. TaxID=1977262 RepID=UPI0035B4E66B
MTPIRHTRFPIPASAGVGWRAAHYEALLAAENAPAWIEVHPENFMGAGGPSHRFLEAARARCPISFHGVGLSLGGVDRPSATHLQRLKELADRYEPASFSEHLAWSNHEGHYLNDLLPVPYTTESLIRFAGHVSEVQDVLKRRILIENPSLYLGFTNSQLTEPQFLSELVARTGCGLLLDVNNVHVSAHNCGYDASAYLEAFPLGQIGEIHLAGHACELDEMGAPVLIDTHGSHVTADVWQLFASVIERTGPVPTLIEWDQDIPSLAELVAEAARAQDIINRSVAHAAAE